MMDAGQRGRGRGVSKGCDGSRLVGGVGEAKGLILYRPRSDSVHSQYAVEETQTRQTQSQCCRKCEKNDKTKKESDSKGKHVDTHPPVNSVGHTNIYSTNQTAEKRRQQELHIPVKRCWRTMPISFVTSQRAASSSTPLQQLDSRTFVS